MLTNFITILQDLARKNCVLQTFFVGYVSEVNAQRIKKWPCLSVWTDGLVGRKEDRTGGTFRVYEMTVEFLTLQGYYNDNSLDESYKGELYKVRKWDQLQQLSDAFFADLQGIEKHLGLEESPRISFMLSDVSSGSRMSRSSWLNAQSGSQYKADQHNARIISVMQTFSVAFPLQLCTEMCCCNGDYCLPPLEIIDPKDLVKPSELKC